MRQESPIMEQLLQIYQTYFDIERQFTVGEIEYDAYAYCNVASAKYVLVEKAELWRACTFEHVFFREIEDWTWERLDEYRHQLTKHIEPEFVRKGKKYPMADHMCTYLTHIFLCQKSVNGELVKRIRRHRFHLNYRFALRGYCESRLVVFDLEKRQIYGNGPAKPLVRRYKELLINNS